MAWLEHRSPAVSGSRRRGQIPHQLDSLAQVHPRRAYPRCHDAAPPTRRIVACRASRPRNASLIIEAVIALALLATTSYGLLRLARSAAVLGQHSSQRLAATLTAENTIERFRGRSPKQILENAEEIRKAVEERSGCQVQIEPEPFTTADRDGVHLRVVVTVGNNVRVTVHDWRFAASGEPDTPKADEPSEDDDA